MIGIMADSHDNLNSIKQAVRMFKRARCSLVIHAGDIVAPFAARELANLSCPVKAIFGNCDGERQGLEKTFSSFGEIKEAPLIFNQKNINFFVTHVPRNLDPLLASGKYHVVIYAHTHKPEIRKGKKNLLINPGETGGWLSGRSTAAILDPGSLTVNIITL